MNESILHLPNWAMSADQNPLELWSHVHSANPILFVGGVHGDEPEGVQLAQDFLSWLRHEATPKLRPWILVPCLNKDGYLLGERTNGNGVDLNRNFPTPDWSSLTKGPRYYPGPHAGSEPETQALVKLINEHKPQLIVHFHSWKPCVVYTGATGKKAAQLLSPSPEYPAHEDIGYPTPGSLGQYGWLVHETPVVCIEEQEHRPLPEIWPQFSSVLKKLMDPQNAIL